MSTEEEFELINEELNIVVILDESGSMSSLGKEPENCLNNFINMMKDANFEKRVLFSLYRFGTNDPTGITVSYKQIPLNEVPSEHGFKPQNWTPLYDAIGMALADNKGKKNGICHIITDGEENSSNKYNLTQVKEMIADMEKNWNWIFQYTGAGLNTYKVGQTLGVQIQNIVQYDKDCSSSTEIAVGFNAGCSAQGLNAIAIGKAMGHMGIVDQNKIAIGNVA